MLHLNSMIYYFDNCATTKVDEKVLEVINQYHTEKYFNPSSLHGWSLAVKKDVDASRNTIKKCLGFSGNLLFTSGGTESDNLAIFGSMRHGGNVVATMVEHSAVYNCLQSLQQKGVTVKFAKTFDDGSVDVEHFLSLVDENTCLAVCMHVNNETGAINDIKLLFEGVKRINSRVLCFSDGVQAVGKIPVNIDFLGADLYSFSSHKIHGTKGVGGLCVKNGVRLVPQNFGGGQENGLRNGTEYVGGIVALATAVDLACKNLQTNVENFEKYKEIFKNAVRDLPDCKIVCQNNCSSAILTFAFANIKSEVLLHMLERENIIVGLGSACSSKYKVSRVHAQLNLPKNYQEGLVRISFSKYTTMEEVEFVADKLANTVKTLRNIIGVRK